MNRRERARVETLERRQSHLNAVLADWKSNGSPDRARAELAAIDWALAVLEACPEPVLATVRAVEAEDRALGRAMHGCD